MKRTLLLLFCLSLATPASAQIPKTLNFQSILTDDNGNLVTDGNYNLTFKIYDAPTAGNLLWSEAHNNTTTQVNVESGVFNVVLGEFNTDLDTLSFENQYYLGITVGAGSELTPRIQFTASPYSFAASTVSNDAITSAKILDSTIITDDINDDAVTSAKIVDGTIADTDIAPNSVVKSINTLTDHVILKKGTNVSIDPLGQDTLVISVSLQDTMGSYVGSLQDAYDRGRTIDTDSSGPVQVTGDSGLVVMSNVGIGTNSPVNTAGRTWLTLDNATAGGAITSQINGTDAFTFVTDGDYGLNVVIDESETSSNEFFQIQMGSTPHFRIDSSGKVGIGTGTSTPSNNLHLNSGVSKTGFKIQNTQNSASNGDVYIDLHNANDNRGYIGLINNSNYLVTGATAGNLIYRSDSANQIWSADGGTNIHMLLSSSGSLGIGDTSPGGNKLSVRGAPSAGDALIRAYSNSGTNTSYGALGAFNSNGKGVYLSAGDASAAGGYYNRPDEAVLATTGNVPLRLSTNGTSGGTFYMDTSGNVGIGTTSPSGKFEVADSSNTSPILLEQRTGYGIEVKYNGGNDPATDGTNRNIAFRVSSGADDNVLDFGQYSSGDATWMQSRQSSSLTTTRDLLINPMGGNVGIGTPTPSTAFDVVGGGTFSSNLTVDASTQANIIIDAGGSASTDDDSQLIFRNQGSNQAIIQYDHENTRLDIAVGSSGTNDVMSIHSDGGVVIGSPTGGSKGRGLNTDSLYVDGKIILSSDKRLKTNIKDLKYGLAQILALRPVSYNWKKHPQGEKNLGLIAQEVQKIIGEIVSIGQDKNQTMGVQYTALIPVLIKAIQEQQAQIEQKDTDLQTQQTRLEKQQIQLNQQQTTIDALLKRMIALENKVSNTTTVKTVSR